MRAVFSPLSLANAVRRQMRKTRQPSRGRQDFVCELERGKSGRPGSENHRQELVRSQDLRAAGEQFFPESIFRCHIPGPHTAS